MDVFLCGIIDIEENRGIQFMVKITENIRLTKSNREKLLKKNEGFTTTTSYDSRNFSEDRKYTIENGSLMIEKSGKTSWADIRYSEKVKADEEETQRFLYNNLGKLDTDINDED